MSDSGCRLIISPYGLNQSIASVFLSTEYGYSRVEFLLDKELVRDACLNYLAQEWPDALTQPALDRIYELEEQLAECRDK